MTTDTASATVGASFTHDKGTVHIDGDHIVVVTTSLGQPHHHRYSIPKLKPVILRHLRDDAIDLELASGLLRREDVRRCHPVDTVVRLLREVQAIRPDVQLIADSIGDAEALTSALGIPCPAQQARRSAGKDP